MTLQYRDALDAITPSSVLAAAGLVREGRILSLESRWWRGMPVHPVHPQFDVLTYRTPHGFAVQGDQEYMNPPANTVRYGFASELLVGGMHTGTHIDAICHVTCGNRDEWHGGYSANDFLGDFGALNSDAASLRPIVARGVLLDIPLLLQRSHCEAGYPIGSSDLESAAAQEGVGVGAGDVVLVRTGQMQFWPDLEAMHVVDGAGVSIDGARWLVERGVIAVGSDTVQFECNPSGVEGSPQPVHVHLIQQQGILIMEWVNCEELAAVKVYEFLFVCLPLTIVGATGSIVRPIAIV